MAQTHEWIFYELMWRNETRGRAPVATMVGAAILSAVDRLVRWRTVSSKEAAFASNAHYRYWNMVGVKDHHQESLVGQTGEVEPVYDAYALSFFLFDPVSRTQYLPQLAAYGTALRRQLQSCDPSTCGCS